MKQHRTKSVLCDDAVRTFLESLYRRFAIVTIYTTAKSYALICKRVYINRLLSEVGIYLVILTPKLIKK